MTIPTLILFVTLSPGLAGCGWFGSEGRPTVPPVQRLKLAVLEFGIGIEVTKLSSVKSVDKELPPEQETALVTKAVREIRENARRLIYRRLETGEQFRLVSIEETDTALEGLGLEPGAAIMPEHLVLLRARLGVDLVVAGVVQDYGKVRWHWLAAGMAADTTAENIVIGLATAWNPVAILANVGFNLLTSTPVWFGGGYLFGVAFRPVRVEAWAVETQDGEEVWKDTEVAIYLRERLKKLPEEERAKKEAQLRINLAKVMEALGDSLLDARITTTTLWELRLPAQEAGAY